MSEPNTLPGKLREGAFRRTALVPICVGLSAAAPPAHAQVADEPSKQACVQTYTQAQELRLQGHLRQAREALLVCSQTACPKVLYDECIPWLAEVERSLPTVVIAVSTSHGEEVVDVRIVMDGEELVDHVEGRAVAVNPGEHVFRVTTRQGTIRERRVVIRQGEKNRILTFRLPARGVPEPEKRPREAAETQGRTIPASAYALGVVSAIAVGGCAYFGLSGKSRQNDLESSCAPNCPEDETDAMYRRYLLADISLGVALVSAGAATWIALSSEGEDKVPSLEAASYPVPGGGTLLLRQRF